MEQNEAARAAQPAWQLGHRQGEHDQWRQASAEWEAHSCAPSCSQPRGCRLCWSLLDIWKSQGPELCLVLLSMPSTDLESRGVLEPHKFLKKKRAFANEDIPPIAKEKIKEQRLINFL